MKTPMLHKLLPALMAFFSVIVSCGQKEGDRLEAPYLEVLPESCENMASGYGDALLLSVRSNVSWTLSAVDADDSPVDWLVFETGSGAGDADILCFILSGAPEEERSCRIVVCSEDGKFQKQIDIIQGKYVRPLTVITLAEILKDAYAQDCGVPEMLPEYTKAKLEVTGVPGNNLPEGYVYVSESGKVWARLKVSQTLAVDVGDILQVDFTGGTITKEANGAYTIELQKEPQVLSSDAPTVVPKYISSAALSSYENMLVELRNVQAPENIAGTAWEGNQTLLATDEKDAVFTVHVEAGASFGNIGTGSGTVRGIVIDGKLYPRSAEDLAGLTGVRVPSYREPYRIAPVVNVIQTGPKNNTIANGLIEDNTRLVFADVPGYSVSGASIEKSGGSSGNNMKIADTNLTRPFDNCFTTIQWHLDDTYMLYTLPVKQRIYGDLDFAFSICCGKHGVFPDSWTVSWSSDGVDFKPVDAVYGADAYTPALAKGSTFRLTKTNRQNNRQVAQFSIPEDEALTSGNIYIRMQHPPVDESCATNTLRMNLGSVLSSRVTNTPVKSYDNVLAMENFAHCTYGHNPVIGVPTYYFTTVNVLEPATTYISAAGWSVIGNSMVSRGCLHLSSESGENYLLSPRLEKLEIPSDINVTFKVAPFVDASKEKIVVHEDNVKVEVSGSGSVGTISWDRDYSPYQWRTAIVKITGASSDTQIKIGNISGKEVSQCYMDEIIISR